MASATWHARVQPTEAGWIDLTHYATLLRTDRLEALGWKPTHKADDVLRRFVDGT
jgi:hypothetical protein